MAVTHPHRDDAPRDYAANDHAEGHAEGTGHGFLSDDRLARLEHLFDQAYRFPGTNFRFGLDGILGLIPGIGDAATAAVSGTLVLDAWKSGARKRVIAKMARNVGVDFVVGSIPLVGDLFDFGYKANTKNIKLLRDERNRIRGQAGQRPA